MTVVLAAMVASLVTVPSWASHGTNEKLEIRSPHGGTITSSPTSHHTPFGGDWAMDIGAGAGTDARVRWGRSTGTVTARVAHVGPACASGAISDGGHQVRIDFSVDGVFLGWILYAHVVPSVSVNQTLSNGTKIGDVGNYSDSSCWTGPHTHLEPRQQYHYACFSKSSGGLSDGTVIGVLGGQVHSGSREACNSSDFSGFPSPDTTRPSGSLDRPANRSRWYPGANISVSGVFDDNVKLDRVAFQVRRQRPGQSWTSWSTFGTDGHDTSSPRRYAATYASNDPIGTWLQYRAVARDKAGNTRATAAVGNNRISGAGESMAVGDLNGDGRDDAVVGVSGANTNTGQVELYVSDGGPYDVRSPSHVFGQGEGPFAGVAQEGDLFGAAVAIGDFDASGRLDVAVGAPGESVNGVGLAGMVVVAYDPLSADAWSDRYWQGADAGGFHSQALEADDWTGASLAAGDFNGDGTDDLAIGAPGESTGDGEDGGVIFTMHGTPAGLDRSSAIGLGQDSGGMSGGTNRADRFGAVLAAGDVDGDDRDDLVVSAPGERPDVGQDGNGAGAAHVIYGSSSGLTGDRGSFVYQGRTMADGTALSGGPEADDLFGNAATVEDFDGDGRGDVALGVPFESIGSVGRAGSVSTVYSGSSALVGAGNQMLHQDSPSTPGTANANDWLGRAVTAYDVDGDGYGELFASVPFDDEPEGRTDAGALQVFRGASGGLVPDPVLHSPRTLTGFDPAADRRPGMLLDHGDVDGDGTTDLVALFQDVSAGAYRPGYATANAAVAGRATQHPDPNASGPYAFGFRVSNDGPSAVRLGKVRLALRGPDGQRLDRACLSPGTLLPAGTTRSCSVEVQDLPASGEWRYWLLHADQAGAADRLTQVFTLDVAGTSGGQTVRRTGRLEGPSRFETAVTIARDAFPDGASVVYLARADLVVDAVAGGVLADGPVLLVPPCGELPAAVAEALADFGPDEVIALGGASAICGDVLAASGRAADGAPTSRLAGGDRYETAVKISERAFPNGAGTTYLARGDVFVDAVAGGVLTDGPILIVPSSGQLPASVGRELDRLAPEEVIALGGEQAVSGSILGAAGTAGGQAPTDRLAGGDRYETATLIAERAFPDGASTAYLARADLVVDAVAGGALTAGPILLVPSCDVVPDAVMQTLTRMGPGRVIALGGHAAICSDVLLQAAGS